MLCGLTLNTLVIEVNAGQMPVVGMPRTLHPINPTWQAATSNTRLLFLADQARLGMFSVGDITLICGSILVLAIWVRRILRIRLGFKSVNSAPVVFSFTFPAGLLWMLQIPRSRKSY